MTRVETNGLDNPGVNLKALGPQIAQCLKDKSDNLRNGYRVSRSPQVQIHRDASVERRGPVVTCVPGVQLPSKPLFPGLTWTTCGSGISLPSHSLRNARALFVNGTQAVEEATLTMSRECAAVGTGPLRPNVSVAIGGGIDTTGFLDITAGRPPRLVLGTR